GAIFTKLVKQKWMVLGLFAIAIAAIFFINKTMPTGFVPNEDRGIIFVNVELPAGASMERTYSVLKEIEAKAVQIKGVKAMTIATGRSFFSGDGSNNGLAFLRLKPFDERKSDPGQSVEN